MYILPQFSKITQTYNNFVGRETDNPSSKEDFNTFEHI